MARGFVCTKVKKSLLNFILRERKFKVLGLASGLRIETGPIHIKDSLV